ncbi:MAG: TraB/GumN family protein [Planctomycetota bacterium]
MRANSMWIRSLAATSLLSLFGCSVAGSAAVTVDAADTELGPQFYEVRDGESVAYLFGTVHLSDERTRTLPRVVETAFLESDALYVELKPGREAMVEMLGLARLPEGTTLESVMGEKDWSRIGDRFERAGLSRSDADNLQPMAPWMVLGQIAFLSDAPPEPVLDRTFSLRSEQVERPVFGLETVTQQLTLFTSLTLEQQAEWLRRHLDTLDEFEAQGRDMERETLDAWASGSPKELFDLQAQTDSGPLSRAEVEHGLLWVRNERFADGIDRALSATEDGSIFVAVGAMHLPNPPGVSAEDERSAAKPRRLGVAELLRARGYDVRRVDASWRVQSEAGAGVDG